MRKFRLQLYTIGALTEPFIPNNDDEGYYGSGIASLWGASEKLGPYADARPLHR